MLRIVPQMVRSASVELFVKNHGQERTVNLKTPVVIDEA